jgi:hypothetical protein
MVGGAILSVLVGIVFWCIKIPDPVEVGEALADGEA